MVASGAKIKPGEPGEARGLDTKLIDLQPDDTDSEGYDADDRDPADPESGRCRSTPINQRKAIPANGMRFKAITTVPDLAPSHAPGSSGSAGTAILSSTKAMESSSENAIPAAARCPCGRSPGCMPCRWRRGRASYRRAMALFWLCYRKPRQVSVA
jgi:hypothetical protein